MRYFVLVSGASDRRPYILAEVVREHTDDGTFRDTSLAANIAGPAARILTDEELRREPYGEDVLLRWRVNVDDTFMEETDRLTAEIDTLEASVRTVAARLQVIDGGSSENVALDRWSLLEQRASSAFMRATRLLDKARRVSVHAQDVTRALQARRHSHDSR